MKVFVAGATGVAGRRAVAQLVEAGHDVTAVARGADKASLLRSLGATPVAVDLFDAGAVRAAVAGHDAVVNLATHIPAAPAAARLRAWAENDRLRTEGARNLVDASLAAGATRYVQESIALNYPSRGDAWIGEETPLEPMAQGRSAVDAEAAAQRVTAAGGSGVVLRFAYFYGPDGHATEAVLRLLRRGVAPTFGPDGWWSSIHVDDAASAVVAALHAPPGVYNVADDEPVTRREYYATLAAAAGLRPPRIPPAGAARLAGFLGEGLSRSQRVSNRRFKEATGWAPRYRSVREGWPASLRRSPDGAARRGCLGAVRPPLG